MAAKSVGHDGKQGPLIARWRERGVLQPRLPKAQGKATRKIQIS